MSSAPVPQDHCSTEFNTINNMRGESFRLAVAGGHPDNAYFWLQFELENIEAQG